MNQAVQYFMGITPKKREELLAHYQKLIDIEEGQLTHFTNKAGKQTPYLKMPWMLPQWKLGFKLLKQVIIDKNELPSISTLISTLTLTLTFTL